MQLLWLWIYDRLTSRQMNSLSSCQTFSIWFRSGDSDEVCHQLICLAWKKPRGTREVFGIIVLHQPTCMFGWKFWTNKWNQIRMKNAYVERCIQTLVAHCLLIAAHTCTFTGCLVQGLSFGLWFRLWKQCLWWHSSWTDVSSFQARQWFANWKRFTLFASQIMWQYLVPLKVHPRLAR